VESPVLIGAGDCPRCEGDVVFDLHGGEPERRDEPQPSAEAGAGRRCRGLLQRLLGH
jgi:hypothetical protein